MTVPLMEAKEGTSGRSTPAPGAGMALALLLAINLFNYIDRQVLAAVEPEIRAVLFPDSLRKDAPAEVLARAKFMMGLLSSAFLVTYMLTSPIFGLLASRWSRWMLIGLGVILWSLASGASGWHWTNDLMLAYWLLFVTRCGVGVGEAAYGPVAPTLLSDLYPIESRGKIMAFFYLAIPVGGALGYSFGEVMAHSELGWRYAFFLVVPPGLLLGLLCFLMPEPASGAADGVDKPRPMRKQDLLVLLRTPSYVLNSLGMTAMTFAIGGLAFWMPAYLVEYREVEPLWGMGPRTAFGAITVVGGFFATILGGLAGDWLRKYYGGSYFLVSGIAMLIGFPMVLLMIYTPFPTAWIFLFLAVFCLFFNTGPTNTILANVTHPSLRATAFAINILVIHLLGDVISPPIMGLVAGLWGKGGEDVSFMLVSAMILVGGILWLWGARYLEADTARAPTTLSAE